MTTPWFAGIKDIGAVIHNRRLRRSEHVQRATCGTKSVSNFGLPGTRGRGNPKKAWLGYVKDEISKCILSSIDPQDRDAWISWRSMLPGAAKPMEWASYQIREIAVCACTGKAGNVLPTTHFKGKPQVSDPGMHLGTCVTHMPWCMSG